MYTLDELTPTIQPGTNFLKHKLAITYESEYRCN